MSILSESVRKPIRESVWWALDQVTRPTARGRVLPDYLIVGAQRAGTTSLQNALSNHPQVMPPRLKKGVHYFDDWFERGLQWYRGQFPRARARLSRQRRLDSPVITGEASPYYLFHPAIPGRIAEAIPDVKLVVLLRDPVERAMSQYKHERRRGYEHLDLSSAIAAEQERLEGEESRLLADPEYRSFSHRHHSYVARGMYAEQLKRYFRHFDRSQVLVVDSEDLWADPVRQMPVVLGFLGLERAELSLPRRNATIGSAVDPALVGLLRERFAEPDRELAELLGRSLAWSR